MGKENRCILRCRSCFWSSLETHTQPLPSFFISDVEINTKSLLIKYPKKGGRVNKAERLAESHGQLHPDKQNVFYCGQMERKSALLGAIPGDEGEQQETWRPWKMLEVMVKLIKTWQIFSLSNPWNIAKTIHEAAQDDDGLIVTGIF